MNKSKLLFLSPTMPDATGHGSAMRAGLTLQALSEIYDISLVVVQLYARNSFPKNGEWSAAYCSEIQVISTEEMVCRIRERRVVLENKQLVHKLYIFRLLMATFVKSFLLREQDRRPYCVLDLDDYESKKLRRFAEIADLTGEPASAAMLRQQAMRCEQNERWYLKRFDHVYVAQSADREEISKEYGLDNVFVLPNCIRVPSIKKPQPISGQIAKILFIGTLDYFPNEDGITWFCSEVLPIIRRQVKMPFQVFIVGIRPSERVLTLNNIPEVTVIGEVESVEPIYSQASFAIVPLRTGSGTRVKILEAFSYGCTVVSTSIGAEGLNIRHGTEILIGDTAETFAQHCITLLSDPAQIVRIGMQGLEWVKRHHSLAQMREHLRELVSYDRFCRPFLCKELDIPSGISLNGHST